LLSADPGAINKILHRAGTPESKKKLNCRKTYALSSLPYADNKRSSTSLLLSLNASITNKNQKSTRNINRVITSGILEDPINPQGPSSAMTEIAFNRRIKNRKRQIVPFMGCPFHTWHEPGKNRLKTVPMFL
jgi:hypothetical protein